MNQINSNSWFLLIIRWSLGSLFIYAGATKFFDPHGFADNIVTFQILPAPLVGIMALGIPLVEIAAGAMMISGWRHRPATLCILFLTTVFALALTQAIARGLQVDCGCFGSRKPSQFTVWMSLGRDMLILIGSAFAYSSSLRFAVGKTLPVDERK